MPKTIEDLKANIAKELKNIDKNILKPTFLNFQKRCNLIIKLNGGHDENKWKFLNWYWKPTRFPTKCTIALDHAIKIKILLTF